ncbi:hypothetical protein MTP99_000829 [Tenebrio molitor]|jgi:hypothetical protein|nr:hypothetical protein MTP99_000829 [Tenebrio molitor]
MHSSCCVKQEFPPERLDWRKSMIFFKLLFCLGMMSPVGFGYKGQGRGDGMAREEIVFPGGWMKRVPCGEETCGWGVMLRYGQ